MRLLSVLLAVVSLVLPPAHRARWREETAALLFEVHGARRWWYALDTMVKAPMLAWCHRVTQPLPAEPGRVVSALAGAALIATPILAVAAVVLAPVLGEPAAEFLFLVSPSGMLGFVVVSTLHRARHRGGGIGRYTAAGIVSIFAGTGPIAAGALSVAVGAPLVAVLGAVVPGGWLATVSIRAMVRRTWPLPLGMLGLAAGVCLVAVLAGVQVASHFQTAGPAASQFTALATVLFIPTYLTWSAWTGIRLLVGRARQWT